MWTSVRWSAPAVVIVSASLLVGCAGAEAPAGDSTQTAPPAAASAPPAALSASAAAAAEPRTVADLFPPGPGRNLVMDNCATCHNVACSAIGQRTPDRWNALRESHRDKVTGADLDKVFAYLIVNFDDTKPEPRVPPAFLEGGCTPF